MTMNTWHRRWVAPVGGLTEIAADEANRYLLVVSAAGRGVYDLGTGERVARDYESPRYDSEWLDETEHRVRGIGALEDVWLTAVGLWGGALPLISGGDRLIVTGDPHGAQSLLLHNGAGELRIESKIVTEIRAVGFLQPANMIVLATSSDVSVFAPLSNLP